TGRREVSALTDARKTLAYDFFRILRAPLKQLFGGSLTLRDYDGQVAEAMGSFAGEGEILR
ncbi:hypothetical protein, partial [Klebsiella pneumoniae]|uniref:hypothetical protein n=1 Tax=Klebsiella pneumoniae TaxID=573 RepID=UPI00249BF3ED